MFRRTLVSGYVNLKKMRKVTKNMTVRLQNYYDIGIRQNKNNLKGMQSSVRVSLFHVASSNEIKTHIVLKVAIVGVNLTGTKAIKLQHGQTTYYNKTFICRTWLRNFVGKMSAWFDPKSE